MSFLPPSILEVMKANGFRALRIEDSGSMRLSISNSIPLEKKAAAVIALKKELKSYGLDLMRSFMTAGSAYDESCLVAKRGELGQTVPLFEQTGELCPEMAAPGDECLARSVKPARSARPTGQRSAAA
jgi:hypothetical protein